MKNLITTTLSLMLFSAFVNAQADTLRYFESYFETEADRLQWTSTPPDPDKKWVMDSKGGRYDEVQGLNFNPDAAYQGVYNALYWWSDLTSDVRTMVSKPIDLSDSKKPLLSFAHAMFSSYPTNNDLTVLFKAGNGAPWDPIYTYIEPVDQWAVRDFDIKSFGAKYLCENFQVAFRSTARGENGVCIDSVVIVEKDVIIRHVKSVKIRNVDQNPLPSGSMDIPLMRVDIVVVGNTDPLVLDSISFASLSSNDNIYANNGFELVATKDSVYKPTSRGVSLKIGSPVSISGGKVTFDNINYNLSTGYNAIWLIADIKSAAQHGSISDFKVGARAININNIKFPSSEISPTGQNVVEQSVFYDDFEGTTGWTVQNDFETGVPMGLKADLTADPDYAYSGTKILGTDLTTDGRYRLNIDTLHTFNAYYATTPEINLKYFTDVKLSFKKWFAFEGNDKGVIEVSVDNGATWTRIWNSRKDALTPDYQWVNFTLTDKFNKIAAHQAAVRVRFGIIFSDNMFAYAGFNIDNFAITGNYLTNDVGLLDILLPKSDCHNPGMDSVKIVVHNYADGPSASSVPVFFSIDGSVGKRVFETIPGPIPKDGTVTYTFTHTADFPEPGDYTQFTVKLLASGDEDPTNDTRVKDIFIQKSVTPPDLESFEIGGGYWKRSGSDPRWTCKIPEGSIPPEAGSSWISSPFGNYLTSDTAYLESSCYDLASPDRLIYEMRLWMDSEPGKDGAVVEYSADDGNTWNLFPAHEFPWIWNWYNGPVTSLGTQGWSGINTTNWKSVKQVMPAALSSESKVKFRIKWASDEDNTYRGMAIDEVKVYAAPPDIGILQIDSFANRCQNLNPDKVTVTIKNFGINSLRQNDTVIVGFDFNHAHLATDTFRLASDLLPGQTMKHTFNTPVDVKTPGNYNLTAYTLIEKDPWFYNGNNDTVSLDFTVYPGPTTSLMDTIQTHRPDTVILRTYYNSQYDYWWNGTNGTNTYNVANAGWQHLKVTATRGNGCTMYDSTNVELLFYDVGAAELVHPVNDCGFSTHEYPVIRVKNFGTDSIVTGQKIAVIYSMNSGTSVSDTLQLTSTLHSGKTTDFTFTKGAIDLSQQGTYSFDVSTSYGGDTITTNDAITRSVEILGRPAISLGPDITVEALSHTLDAGSGYTRYQWDNAETGQTREVTTSGSYWVQVFDANQCDNYDTANIRLKIRDISPGGFESPVSACQFSSNEPVSLRIFNSGTDTVPAGTAISLSYRFGAETRINANTNLAQQLVPGSSVSYTFPETLDLSIAGDYQMEATTVITGDLRESNDTADITIYRYNKPVIDFGLQSTEYVEDVSLLIEAGYSPWYTYQWQDTVTTHDYMATLSGLYYVKATDTRTQCYDGDSVRVYLIYSDVGVTWTDMPVNGCTGELGNVKVRVENLGPSAIGASAPIYIACDVNGTRAIVDTLVRTGNFNPGASLDLDLSGKLVIGSGGISSVAFYTIYGQDKKPENDTLLQAYDALQGPVIDFGDDNGNLKVDLPYVLDAGIGHKLYMWQDNSTEQTYTVTTDGTYSVTVTGQNDCQTKKTVRINMWDGTEDIDAGILNVLVYPNPNQGLFNVSADTRDNDNLNVFIYNIQGQVVYIREFTSAELANEKIDVQHLSRGVYQILIQGNGKVYRGKMVIE